MFALFCIGPVFHHRRAFTDTSFDDLASLMHMSLVISGYLLCVASGIKSQNIPKHDD